MSYDLSGGTMLLGAYVVSIFCIIAGVYYTFAVAPFKEQKSAAQARGRPQAVADGEDGIIGGGAGGGPVDMEAIDAALAGLDEGGAEGVVVDGEDIQVPQRMRALRVLSKKDLHKAEKKKLKSDRKAYLDSEKEQREERRLAKEKRDKERELLSEARYLQQRLERKARGEVVSSSDSDTDADGEGDSDDGGRKTRKKAHPEKALAKSAYVNSAEMTALEMRSYVVTHKRILISTMASHFGTSEGECVRVISDALHRGDVIGVFDQPKHSFFLFTEEMMNRLADHINAAGKVSSVALDETIRGLCMDMDTLT